MLINGCYLATFCRSFDHYYDPMTPQKLASIYYSIYYFTQHSYALSMFYKKKKILICFMHYQDYIMTMQMFLSKLLSANLWQQLTISIAAYEWCFFPIRKYVFESAFWLWLLFYHPINCSVRNMLCYTAVLTKWSIVAHQSFHWRSDAKQSNEQ